MPKQKDLKRRVRARMRKTGESYTAARARLLEKRPAALEKGPAANGAASTAAPEPDYAALAGMSDATIEAKTGCNWKRWVRALDAVGAASLPHREIAALVHEKWRIPGWWTQAVTVGYERIKGLREKGQRRGGGYEVGKSKTFPVPVAMLYAAFGARARARWLGDAELTVRKATPRKTLRVRWSDGTPLEAYFVPKGAKKSVVTIQHRGLATRKDAERMRAYWTERLDALGALLAGPAR